ncbi:CBU_1594 family Dot/Icm type IV secretion system effector [soil metagenome]
MTASTIKIRIDEELKNAMRAKDMHRVRAVRLITAAIKQREVDERIVLTDAQVITILNKMLKQRQDSLTQFQSAGRQDLADQEIYEIKLIEEYLPASLSETEIDAAIRAAIQSVGATSAKEMGKVMAILKDTLQGRADLTKVSDKVKQCLAA